MKFIALVIVFSCGLWVGCWHEDLSGFKFHQTWAVNLDSIYSRPSPLPARLAIYFNLLTTPAGESFVMLKGIKNDQMQFIISKISADGKVVKELSKPLENDLVFPYRESSLSGGKLTVLLSTGYGYQNLILQLDTDLNVLKETPFTPPPYFYPRFTLLGDYVYSTRNGPDNNTYFLDKMDLTGNLIWNVSLASRQFPIISISNRGTILTTQSDLDSAGMVTSISIGGYGDDGTVVGKRSYTHIHGLEGQGCGSSAIEVSLVGLSGSTYLVGPNYPLGLSYFSISPAGELIYAKTSPTHTDYIAEMAQGDLVYLNTVGGLTYPTTPTTLQLVQLNRVGNPVWMTNFDNYSPDRGVALSTDGGGNAYVLANGQILRMKR